MKFATSLVFAAAAATAVLAAPKPQEDGGKGIPPSATVSESSSTETTSSAPTDTKVPDAPKGDHQPDIKIPFSTSNALITLTPPDADSWAVIEAPGVWNVSAHFAIKNQDKAGAKFEPPQAYAGIEIWMYQRSDGGVASLLIDGVALARLDYYNKTAGKDDPPVKVYENPNLRRDHHVLEFRNVEDPRVKKFGQFNIDHIVITAEADAPQENAPAPPAETTSTPEPEPSTKDTPPLTAPTVPVPPESESQTAPPPPGGFASALSAPKAVLSVATLIAATLALF